MQRCAGRGAECRRRVAQGKQDPQDLLGKLPAGPEGG